MFVRLCRNGCIHSETQLRSTFTSHIQLCSTPHGGSSCRGQHAYCGHCRAASSSFSTLPLVAQSFANACMWWPTDFPWEGNGFSFRVEAQATARKHGTSAQVGVAPSSKLDLSDDGDRQWDGRIVWISRHAITFVSSSWPSRIVPTPGFTFGLRMALRHDHDGIQCPC